MTRIIDGRDAGAFITAALDDFGLDPYAFRIYARIVRRAGTKQGCFESVDNIAKACRMNRDTAYKALKTLLRHRLIEKEVHAGRPSSYYLTPCSEWIHLPDLSQIGDTEPVPNKGHHLSQKRDTTYPKNGTPPIPNKGHKGIKEGIKEGTTGRMEKAGADAGGEDPFFLGQAKQIAREVAKQTKQPATKNFLTDSPWGELAQELDQDPKVVWEAFDQFMLAVHSDKQDPEAYVGKVLSSLFQNPGTELANKHWVQFSKHFRKTLSAPPVAKKAERRQPQLVEIPDRIASAEAIRRARHG